MQAGIESFRFSRQFPVRRKRAFLPPVVAEARRESSVDPVQVGDFPHVPSPGTRAC